MCLCFWQKFRKGVLRVKDAFRCFQGKKVEQGVLTYVSCPVQLKSLLLFTEEKGTTQRKKGADLTQQKRK